MFPAFAARGLAADTGLSWMLPRLAGTGQALKWLWNAERIPAALALESGLVEEVVPDGEVLSEAIALADRWAHGATVALGQIKRQVYASLTNTFAEQLLLEEDSQGYTRPQGRDDGVPRTAGA